MKPQRTLIEVPHIPERGLGSYTWEERRRMTAAELIKAMGSLHVSHPDYKARPRTLLPMPNLAGHQPVFTVTDPGFFSLCKSFIRWAAQ